MSYLKIILCVITCLFTVIKAGSADIFTEEKIITTIGGSETKGIRKLFITKDKILFQDPAFPARFIFDYNKNKVYSINDTAKDISIYSLEKFILPVDTNFCPDFADLKDSDLHVKESGNKKQINHYSCFEVVIYAPRIAAMTNVWLSSLESPLTQQHNFAEKHGSILLKKILPILKKNNACIIESTTIIVRPNESERYLRSELLKFSIDDIPDFIFSLPENYRILNIN
jgi:hypothetical protein